MKSKNLFSCILAVLFLFPLRGIFGQEASFTFDLLATYDYPGVGNSTYPQKINTAGEIGGEYTDSSGVERGFVRFRNGNFSAPIVEPNDAGNFTDVRGINNMRTLCGYYSDGTNSHGFFFSGNTFTEFDVPDAITTYIFAINDAGDFSGTFDNSTKNGQGYLSISGNITAFSVPGAVYTDPFGMNNSDQLVGEYADSSNVDHGFFRDTDGTLTFPIDPPGSTLTFLFGNNDRGWMVGRYTDGAGVTHALFFTSPTRFVVYDYPGVTFTSFNGINRQGLICGRYEDSSSIGHGILMRVRRVPANQSAFTLRKTGKAFTPQVAAPGPGSAPAH